MGPECFCSTFPVIFAIGVFLCSNHKCLADTPKPRHPKELELPSTKASNFATDHDQDEFITELFVKYGDGHERLSFQGFKTLMGNIGLGGDRDRMHDHRELLDSQPGQEASQHRHAEYRDSVNEKDSPGDEHPTSSQEPISPQDWESQQESPFSGEAATADEQLEDEVLSGSVTPTRNEKEHNHLTQCLSPDALLEIFEIPASATGLSKTQFVQMCPVLLQQLDSHSCMVFDVEGDNDSHDDDHGNHGMPTEDDHDHDHTTQDHHGITNGTGGHHGSVSGHIWGYGIAAISLISMASIACILVVPCMQHYPHAYQRLLTVLVAMAVGTLAGDAMMHLIPHSFGIHVHDDSSPTLGAEEGDGHAHEALEDEKEHARKAVWKGFFVLVGIFIFFIIEQLMGYCQQARKKRKARQKIRKRSDPKSSSQRPLHRASSASQRENSDDQNQGDYKLMVPGSDAIGEKLCYHCVAATKLAAAPGHNREIIRNSMLLMEDLEITNQIDQSATSNHHNHNHNHHHNDPETSSSHHHGHSHDPPSAAGQGGIATLVWIVVMGDGLHNFCDGLIVGAAFADSIAGGLSTSIAVMCHEVPHELGDFAVMLKGGMSIKQALCVQAVSSVLAYIGLAIGIAAGDVEAVSMWIFALAGGMFVYIALVDLFPELIEMLNSKKGKKLQFLILQSLGTILGVLIMLVIGLHEDWLREQLDG